MMRRGHVLSIHEANPEFEKTYNHTGTEYFKDCSSHKSTSWSLWNKIDQF
jgi:hypothetical protein